MDLIQKKKFWVFLLGLAVGVLVCFLIFLLLPKPQGALEYRGSILRRTDLQTPLTSPLLAVEVGTEKAFPELQPAKTALSKVIEQSNAAGGTKDVSVYYRLLNSGRWFEINGNASYAPASLLKVFVMVAYYAEAENTDNPALLQKQIQFEGSVNPALDTPGEVIPHFMSGQQYSIEDVISQMIKYSDNDALSTLIDNFGPSTLKEFNQIFTDLQIPSPTNQKESSFNFLSVEQYAMIFRVLYSTTYLSPRYSQLALDLLSKAHYSNGIVAGVPPGTLVAHKFGVTTNPTTSTSPALPELHDCGIVYYPGHPYLLCIMTRGSNFASLQDLIKKISATAFQQTGVLFNAN